MALRDPELMAAASWALGVDALAPLFSAIPTQAVGVHPDCPGGPPIIELQRQHHPMDPVEPRKWEDEGAAKMRQQEAELAQLEREADNTRRQIAEARRRAEESAALAAASAAREAAREQQAFGSSHRGRSSEGARA